MKTQNVAIICLSLIVCLFIWRVTNRGPGTAQPRNNGHESAEVQFNLGRCYYYGDGVPVDKLEAVNLNSPEHDS